MTDENTLKEIQRWTRINAQHQQEKLQIELLRYWNEEMAKLRNTDPKRLLRYGFKTYSQIDEDGIIQEIFQRIGTSNRTFVEFGVQNGLECNSAKLLLGGWRGLWIEADVNMVAAIRANYSERINGGQLKLSPNLVTAENINSLLGQAGMTDEVDMLCIDVDGNDYWIWKALDAIRPRLVVIEYNAIFRPPLSLVIPYNPAFQWKGGSYFGASLEALVKLGRTKGYRIVGCCFAGVNAFFVREDLCEDRFVSPATAEEHFEPARYFARMLPLAILLGRGNS